MHFILLDVKGLAVGIFRLGLNLHAFVKQADVWVGSVCLPLGYSLSLVLSVRLPLLLFFVVVVFGQCHLDCRKHRLLHVCASGDVDWSDC